VVDEWDAGILSIHAMAGDAVMRERLLAVLPVFAAVGQRILLLFIADKDVVLGERDRSNFKLARWACLAPGQPYDAACGNCCDEAAHL